MAALALALALTPLYVSLCHTLSGYTRRGAQRLVATQRGSAELERLRAATSPLSRAVAVAELPGGRCVTTVGAPDAGGLRRARVEVSWTDDGRPGRAEWTTVVFSPRRH